MKKLLIILLCLASMPALAAETLTIEKATALTKPPAANVSAVFLTITNTGEADKLTAVKTTLEGARAELHTIATNDKGAMEMRPVPGFDIPAGGKLELTPGGDHIMLMDVTSDLKENTKIPLTFVFEKAGEKAVEADVVMPQALMERFPPKGMPMPPAATAPEPVPVPAN